MSLINKMLQELDKRHAAQSAGATSSPVLEMHLRAVHSPVVGTEWFWRVLAAIMLVGIAWVGWLMWQLSPRSNVTDLVFQVRGKSPLAAPAEVRPAQTTVAAGSPAAPNAAAPVPSAPARSTVATTAARPTLQDRAKQPTDMFKLATEMTTPVKERRSRPSPDKQTLASISPGAKALPPPAPADVLLPKPPVKAETVAPPRRGEPGESSRINKRDNATPQERAAAEFRRAVNFVNQGRMSEAMDAFRNALALDPTFETARQTQVALLVEAKRVDEAAALLQEGIQLNPANVGFIMLLARIMVERADVGGALALLQKHARAAANHADYHAFIAALYQRLGRHKEAIDAYQEALRISPGSGAWWVGLGISQEAASRPKEALEAFKRAKASGSLPTELLGYVDNRLRQLQ